MKKKSFNISLSLDDVLHCEIHIENRKLTGFVLQYSARIDGKMRIISCIDTHHNRAHRHIFHKASKGTKRRIFLSDDVRQYNSIYNEYRKKFKNEEYFIKLKEDYLKNI